MFGFVASQHVQRGSIVDPIRELIAGNGLL
jgi:hypothetical protein